MSSAQRTNTFIHERIGSALLDWYARHGRDLPWRATRAPYPVWISEIMLQQTQVKTVLPRYTAWFNRFPTVQALASAPLDDVLKAWEGLGYYRRALLLHEAAGRVVAEHHGQFPHAYADILKLPGIGRSTAGAIASFCFGLNTPVLDGNVKRVLRRWHDAAQASDTELWELARSAMDEAPDPGGWNQAMMELGATICIPRRPACRACPAATACRSAFKTPAETSRRPARVKDVYWQVHLHADPEKGLWLTKRPESGIWAGLWTPPITELAKPPGAPPCHIHQLTHRRLHLYGAISGSAPSGDGRWASDLTQFALPTGIHRLLAKYGLHRKNETRNRPL